MEFTKLEDLNPHNIAAVVVKGIDSVEVRYADGKKPVRLKGVTTSQVMVHVLQKEHEPDADSGE
jgi:hypothetical protein